MVVISPCTAGLADLQAWGVMEFQLGRYDEARRLFQEGVWADPGNKDVVFIFQVCVWLCQPAYA
jgi:hypothetical protein